MFSYGFSSKERSMDRVSTWHLRPTTINLICQAIPEAGSSDLPEYSFREGAGEYAYSGPWKVCRVKKGERHFSVFLYRKRVIISWEVEVEQRSALAAIDDFIRFYLRELAADMQTVLKSSIEADSVNWRYMPLLVGDLKINRFRKQYWQSDGITSFQMRLYNSSQQRAGFVRVSRHLVLCAGIGPRLQQDIVNLIYEKLLYSPQIDADCVFAFIDGLSRYVLPTELNIFLQGAIARLTVVFSVSAIVIAISQIFAANFDWRGKLIVLTLSVLVIGLTWFLSRFLRLVEWE